MVFDIGSGSGFGLGFRLGLVWRSSVVVLLGGLLILRASTCPSACIIPCFVVVLPVGVIHQSICSVIRAGLQPLAVAHAYM